MFKYTLNDETEAYELKDTVEEELHSKGQVATKVRVYADNSGALAVYLTKHGKMIIASYDPNLGYTPVLAYD